MATRTQLRAMLQRRLQDTANSQWTDAVLNDYLNHGLQYMQKRILEVDPMAFVYTDTATLTSSVSDYPMPSNSMWEVGVFIRESAGGEYTWLDRIERPWLQAGGSANWQANPFPSGYARKGRYIVIHPTPTLTIATGLKLEYVPWLTMGSDADVPEVDIGLHEGIVYRAEEIALGDTAQEAIKAKEDLGQVVTDISRYYRRSGGMQRLNPMETMAQYQESE